MKLREEKISSTEIYKGKIINLYKDTVLCPNGRTSTRELIRHCEAVCVLAELDGKFAIEQQYRYPYDAILNEFPAGKVDKGEDLQVAALRELEEEIGYKANKIVYLGKMYPSCAYTDEVIHLYYATDLIKTERHLDIDEAINFSFITMDEINELIKTGQLNDAKSLCILQYYNLLIKNK